jgi:uncharacterized membrane protein
MPGFLFATVLSVLLVIHSRRKKSLTKDGAAGAFVLGMATFSANLYFFTVVLLGFFLSSSKLTKVCLSMSRLLDIHFYYI